MARQISMATRTELLAAIKDRYRASARTEKRRILNEFVAISGYHRKHAIRLLREKPGTVAAHRGLHLLYGTSGPHGFAPRDE
jgi:hypothetical protein